MKLIDDHGRQIKKIRISLTDKCNLRCHYCMPVDQTFMNEEKYLSAQEYSEILAELYQRGVEEVRLTGGEPLLRKSFSEILNHLGTIPFKKLALTTNGILLERHFENLIKNRVFNLNISLDSLDQENFKKITRGDYLNRVIANILEAKRLGFIVKINMVVMKGINDHEVMDFVHFSAKHGIEVRFLEIMRIGHALNEQNVQFISASALIKRISLHHNLKSVTRPLDSTSFNYITETGAQLGFIASESQPFCGQCSRWRLSADGILRACLLKDDGISLKNKNESERHEIYQSLLGMKPHLRPKEVLHHMNSIGG